jgi:hypothetical protein
MMPWDPRSSTSKCDALPEYMEVSMKMCATVVEFANCIMHRCYHFHRLWSSIVWRIRRYLWQTRTTCKCQFTWCMKICVLPEVLSISCSWRAAGKFGDITVVGAECNHCKSALDASWPNSKLTERRSGLQRLSSNCTFEFDIERFPISGGGAPIHVTKVATDHIEGAIHHDDSSVPYIK